MHGSMNIKGKIIVVYFNLYVLDSKWQGKVFVLVYFSLLRVQIAAENIVVMKRLVANTAQMQPVLNFLVYIIPVPQ